MKSTPNSLNHRDLLVLLLVVLVAALLRFGSLASAEFFHDEAMLSMLAQDMAHGTSFPTEGILSSVGIPNPPTSVYIMALPYRLADDPLFATGFIAALNVVGVGLLWLLAYRYLGKIVAGVAGLIYAINPWSILYSRKIWAQDYHTPLVLLAVLLGLYGFVDEGAPSRSRQLAQVLCLPILLFALQIHFAAWVLLPLYGVLLWTGRRRTSWRILLMSAVLSLLVLLPYGIGLAHTLEQDPTRITDTLNRSEATKGLSISGDALVDIARLATGLGVETWVAPQQTADLPTTIPLPAGVVIGIATLIGILALWKTTLRAVAMLIYLWIGLPLLVFTPTWTAIYPHYFIACLPAFALLAGVGIASLIRVIESRRFPTLTHVVPPLIGSESGQGGKVNSPWRWVLGVAFALLLITQAFWWQNLLHFLDTTPTPNGYTTPLHYLLAVRDELAQYDDVIILSNGMDVLYDQEPARWSVFLRDTARCVRTLPGDGYALFPQGKFIVAAAPNAPANPIGNLYTTDQPMIFPVRPNDGEYRLYRFDQAPPWTTTPITAIIPAQFSNDVQLTGYHVEPNRLYLEWRLPAPNPALDFQYFAHFLNAGGDKITQRDAVFLMGRHWCAGDRLITWTDVAAHEGTKTLRIGMYQLGTGRTKDQYFSADVLDSLGNPAGQWVDIPLP